MAMTVRSAQPLHGAAVLSLAACKKHLRRLDSDEDDLVASLRDAAIDWVERYTGQALALRSWVATFDRFDATLRMPMAPVATVTAIAWLDAGGVAQVLAPAAYRQAGDMLLAAAGQCWPPASGAGAVTVAFTAGHAAGAAPPGLLAAVKMLLTHLFVNRAAVVTGTIATSLPLGVTALCDQHRLPVLA